MTFVEIIHEVIGKDTIPLNFYVLKESVAITTRETPKIPAKTFRVVALAISGPWDETPFLFALAVKRKASRLQFTVLSKLLWNGDDEWVEARKIRFKRWVTEWLQNHPEEILRAGIVLGHKEDAGGNIRVHYTVLQRIRWITSLAEVHFRFNPGFDSDVKSEFERARNNFIEIGDIAGNILRRAGYEVLR